MWHAQRAYIETFMWHSIREHIHIIYPSSIPYNISMSVQRTLSYNKPKQYRKPYCMTYSTKDIYSCSGAQSCQTVCDLIDYSTPGFPVLPICQNLLKLMSVGSVMPSNHLILCRPLLLPSIFPSIMVFPQWISSSHQVAKISVLQLQHPSFQWIFRVDFL